MRALTPFTDDETRAFVAEARRLVHTKFGHHGRSERKLDCAGLAILAARRIGKTPVDLRAYGAHPARNGMLSVLIENLGAPVDDGPRFGDVLLMAFDGEPHHVGIVGSHDGMPTLIHSNSAFGKVVEHRLTDEWTKRIVGVFRP
jgi:hypothetical protein